jgi:glycosyltransferase involved in cell wall biosynthesis
MGTLLRQGDVAGWSVTQAGGTGLGAQRALRSPPLLGLGMPVFNGERFVGQAIEALLGQSFTDFELLISDNASTDATRDICETYAALDDRVRYVRHPANGGLPRNWNFVFRESRGQYFKWAAADDFVSPNFLAECVALLEQKPDAVIAFGGMWLVDDDGGTPSEYADAFEVAAPSAAGRFFDVASRLGLNAPISGVIRRGALQQTALIRPYPGSDVVLMAELALQGTFRMNPAAAFYRRLQRGCWSEHLDPLSCLRLHDPAANGTEPVTVWRCRDLLLAALRARALPVGDRLVAIRDALRLANWARRDILRELAAVVMPGAMARQR